MKYLLLLITLFLISCKKAYYGNVYDFETKQPLASVEINDYMNNTKTYTNSKGYFYLKHTGNIAGKLIFKKAGYDIDTLETIRVINGEFYKDEFKGDTIYLFGINNNFRDSINKLNSSR